MPSPLDNEIRVMVATEKRAMRQLATAYSAISVELDSLRDVHGPTALLTQSQLRQTRYAIQGEMASLWRRVGDVVEAGKLEAAREAGDLLPEARALFEAAGLSPSDIAALRAGMRQGAERGVEAAMKRMELRSYKSLSKRVYENAVLMSGRLNNIIDQSLLRGANAADLAKAVKDFVRPDTPGGVQYAARRLARTEINNAFHAVTVDTMKSEPFVTHSKWNLSGSHKVPDDCNRYAEETHVRGGEPGVYPVGRTPARPHPQCLCYVTAEDIGRDEFIKQFQEGKYDSWLEEQLGETSDDVKPNPLPNPPLVKPKPKPNPVPNPPKVETPEERARRERLEAEAERQRIMKQAIRNKAEREAAKKAEEAAKEAARASDKGASGLGRAKHKYDLRHTFAHSPAALKDMAKKGSPLKKVLMRTSLDKLKGEPLSHEDAWKGTNPFNRDFMHKSWFKKLITTDQKLKADKVRGKIRDPWSINCQRVSAAYELRRRGFKVAAGSDVGTQTHQLANLWKGPEPGDDRRRQFKQVFDTVAMEKVWKEEPDGARFLVYGPWKSGGAHIWNAEKINGELHYIEAQVDAGKDGIAIRKRYDRGLNWSGGVGIMRVDDLEPHQDMFDAGFITEGAGL